MNPKKQRQKNRRRAHKLAQEAWEAAEDNRPDLAVKIIRRAVELNPANPVLWHDQASLLVLLGDNEQAAFAFQAALQLAPDFAEAYADFAALRVRQGQIEPAVALQHQAVRHARYPEPQRQRLAAYEALLTAKADMPKPADLRIERSPPEISPDLAASIERQHWAEIDGRLTERGFAHVPQLLNTENCESLRAMFHDDLLFAKTVTMDKERFGKGVYRYFAAPIPPLVDALRQLVYPHLAAIANRWQRLLNCEENYPANWPQFRERCAQAGQTTPSPLLLRYEAGGFNALHQDLRGEVYFPVQMVMVLSRRVASATDDDSFTGGEFLFCDQPGRKPSDRREVPAGLGDAVFFCTCSRLVRVGGVYGLQPVKHGLNRVESGVRYAVGIPFHEFR